MQYTIRTEVQLLRQLVLPLRQSRTIIILVGIRLSKLASWTAAAAF